MGLPGTKRPSVLGRYKPGSCPSNNAESRYESNSGLGRNMFHNFIRGNSCIKEVNEGGVAELEYKREILSARIPFVP